MHPYRSLRALALLTALAIPSACGPGEPVEPPPVEPRRAWSYLTAQTSLGPRVAGLPGHARQVAWLRRTLALRADTVVEQRVPFTRTDGRPAELVNFLARFNPDSTRRVLLVAGWDTPPRVPRAEISGYSAGANEAAAGVAVLLELADLFRERAPAVGVDLLFADGTDQGLAPQRQLVGVRHFAETLPADYRPAYAVVLRGVGDREPTFPREGLSVAGGPEVVERIWERAREMELAHVFLNVAGDSVPGAHAVLQRAGIPAVLLSDPQYGPDNRFARSPLDQARNVSRETLETVARVLAATIYAEDGR